MAKRNTQSEILSYLMDNKGDYISGEKLAEALDISRTAIWQAIWKLKERGIKIESSGNKGYLYTETDIMTEEGIRHYLPEDLRNMPIYFYDSIDSTNKQAKRDASENTDKIRLYVTPYQTGGYGRFGRAFIGDNTGGIYMTIVLKPDRSIENMPLITIKTAIAEKRAIDEIAHIDTKIKWVNDIFYNGKKLSGILTEGITDYESGMISTIIIGIGINFAISEFPEELRDIAGSIFDKTPKYAFRNELVARFMEYFIEIYDKLDTKDIISEYKAASFVLGENVTFVKDEQNYEGKAVDINDAGELVVELTNGERMALFSGEISVKLKK